MVIGEVIEECYLMVEDSYFGNNFVDLLFDVLFGKVLKMYCEVEFKKV